MLENSYSIQEFGQLINQHGYNFDLNKNPKDNGLIDEIDFSSRPEIFIGACQGNEIKIIFKYDGIGAVTLFDPNEKDIKINTVTLNIPINGYFFDAHQDALYPRDCYLKSYEPYGELRLGFFEYIDLFISDSGEQNFDWLKGRDKYGLKCIYCIDLSTVSNLLDNVRIVINSDSKLIKNIKSAQEPIGCGNPTIQQTEPNIESLNAEIARLRNLLADQTTEIQDLKSKIQELETHPTIQDDNPDILALILDETQTDRYAPDLVYSIKLWLDVYVNNPKADSHNNKANTWIKNNTPYNGEQDDTPTRRIREIATPFRDLHQSRKRLLENK